MEIRVIVTLTALYYIDSLGHGDPDYYTDIYFVKTRRFKLFKQGARTDLRRHSFVIRVVQIWNSLPNDIVCASSVNSFKTALDNFWKNSELYFNDHRAEVTL